MINHDHNLYKEIKKANPIDLGMTYTTLQYEDGSEQEFETFEEAQSYRDLLVDSLEDETNRSNIHRIEEEIRRMESMLLYDEDPALWGD